MPTLDYLLEKGQITPEALAAASGLERSRVLAIVDGRWTPSQAERDAIAQILGLPADQIAFGHNMNARNIRFHRFGLTIDLNSGGAGAGARADGGAGAGGETQSPPDTPTESC